MSYTYVMCVCIQTAMKIRWHWGYPDLHAAEPSPCLPFFISVIVFWIMTFFRRQNSVRLRCFFAETDIIQSVST